MRFIFWCLCVCISLSARQLDLQVNARSALLMNAKTGAILFEKNSSTTIYPASTTKIGTSIYLLDQQVDFNRQMTVSADSIRGRAANHFEHPYWLDVDGATLMGLKRGEIVTLESLFHGLVLVSGNDAANVIAESVGGSIQQFMDGLNEYLKGIGCKGTHFVNPSGLHHAQHQTTAYDLALMMKRGLEIPKFKTIYSTLTYKRPKTNKQPEGELKMVNPMLRPKSSHYYSKTVAGKTGYHKAAKYNLVAAAEHEGRTLIAVALGCDQTANRYQDAKRLFETAFAEEKATRRLMGPEQIFTKEVVGSKAHLRAAVIKPLSIEYFPSEEPKCKAALHWGTQTLPIRKGQKVGEVHIMDENNLFLQKGELIALEEVKGTFLFTIKQKLFSLFR